MPMRPSRGAASPGGDKRVYAACRTFYRNLASCLAVDPVLWLFTRDTCILIVQVLCSHQHHAAAPHHHQPSECSPVSSNFLLFDVESNWICG